MNCRSFAFAISIVFLLVGCTPNPTEEFLPTVSPVPPTQTFASPTAAPTEWLNALEVIHAGNWSRLQLLTTFSAEMPLNHSAVAISPDGKTMAVGSSSGANISFFDLASGQLSQVLNINGVYNATAYFNVIEYLPDGTLIANSDGPYEIYHIDSDGNVLAIWDAINFALSADKRTLAYGTVEGITLMDIAGNQILSVFGAKDAMGFSFSPDGSKIAVDLVGVDYVNTEVWDIATQTRLATNTETANVRFSPDGKFLAATSYEDETTPLKILSPDGANEITTLKVNDPNGLNGRAPLWSADGSIIAAQIAMGSPVAWETANWKELESPALEGELYSFSPDGRILITRTSDGEILLWGVLP